MSEQTKRTRTVKPTIPQQDVYDFLKALDMLCMGAVNGKGGMDVGTVMSAVESTLETVAADVKPNLKQHTDAIMGQLMAAFLKG